eukprot:GHUV01004665.1.p1 GENE.GHUV01004665.1~~GHUV01004665.1.p1  ORF type:complete len:122 (+),score=3.64 GHUV01004665.1:339-704(+)
MPQKSILYLPGPACPAVSSVYAPSQTSHPPSAAATYACLLYLHPPCRSVHRGSYFAGLRTTTVRKLLPESWGFLCPVHTPDGSPCGLLNHFTAACNIITHGPEQPVQTEDGLIQVGRQLCG